GARCSDTRAQRRRGGYTCSATVKNAAAEERPLERAVAVHAAAPETGDLARGIDARQRLAERREDACAEIGLEPTERLARQDGKPHGDQRARRGIENPVRLGDPDQPVAQVAASAVDRGDLRVLAEGI